MKKPAPRVILALAEDLGPLFPGETVAFVQAHVGWYLHTDGGSVVADLFGTEERFNVPGATGEENWTERFPVPVAQWDSRWPDKLQRIKEMIKQSGRLPS